jgi:hypothetical protein
VNVTGYENAITIAGAETEAEAETGVGVEAEDRQERHRQLLLGVEPAVFVTYDVVYYLETSSYRYLLSFCLNPLLY